MDSRIIDIVEALQDDVIQYDNDSVFAKEGSMFTRVVTGEIKFIQVDKSSAI